MPRGDLAARRRNLLGSEYLLGWALRREQRDKDAVMAIGAVLMLCGLLLLDWGL